MAYSNKTSRYYLPFPSAGDILDGTSENLKANTIENQLFGAIRCHSGGTGIVTNGPLSVVNGSNNQNSVIMTSDNANGRPVIQGFINQIWIYTTSTITWPNLASSTTYYLGVRLVESTTQSSRMSGNVIPFSNTTGIIPTDGLLVAIVVLDNSGNATFFNNPVGRINIPVLGDHINNNQNPHTPFLYQDDLAVSGITVLDFLRYRTLTVDNFIISGNTIISGTITVLGNLNISGNVTIQGNLNYQTITANNLPIPNTLTVGNIIVSSGLDVYSTSIFRQPITLNSGVTIDGFRPSLAIPLINGSNADNLHGHVLGSIGAGVKVIQYSPEYMNTVISGQITSGAFSSIRNFNNNYYSWYAMQSGICVTPITRITLPSDFVRLDRIELSTGVGTVLSGNNVVTSVYDKDFNLAPITTPLNGFQQFNQVTNTVLTISGGSFFPNKVMTVQNCMTGASGVQTLLGDMNIFYVPQAGEKIVYSWEKSVANGSQLAAEQNFNGLRVVGFDSRIERVEASSSIGLSGNSVFGINVFNNGVAPSTIYTSTPKPTLNFGKFGSSFVSIENIPTENTTILKGQLISASLDLVASGCPNASIQLITYRI